MIRALWTAASGLEAQQMTIDVISNNLANVNTTGYKRAQADFQDLMYQTFVSPGTSSSSGTIYPTGIEVGHGTRLVAVQKLFSQGDYKQTQNPLDLAIEGDGFFQVLQPNGQPAYTRAGAFKRDMDGRIVNSDGYVLEPEIVIPPGAKEVTVGADGTVSVLLQGQTSSTAVGTIQVVRFVNPAGLRSIGKNLFMPSPASGDAEVGTAGGDGFGTVMQGFLEMSNVNVVNEMINLIIAQRAYEVNSKVIQAADDMLNVANNVKR